MTALSLSLALPDAPGEAAEVHSHARRRRALLLALEHLLQSQWDHYRRAPPTAPFRGLRDLLDGLLSHARCSVECFPLALALLDRLLAALRSARLGRTYAAALAHVPRLFAVLLLASAKYRDEACRPNSLFSQLAGMPLAEWNALERFVLRALRYTVAVPHAEYVLYEALILAEMRRLEETPPPKPSPTETAEEKVSWHANGSTAEFGGYRFVERLSSAA